MGDPSTQGKFSPYCGDVFEQLARYTMRYQESDLHLAFILLNLLNLFYFSLLYSTLLYLTLPPSSSIVVV